MIKQLKLIRSLGIASGVLAAGVAAASAVMLKKWKDDPESGDIRVVFLNGKGVKLSKDEAGKVVVDTHYDAAEDPIVTGEEEPRGPVLVVDLPEKAKEFTREAGEDVKAAAEIAADKAGAAAEQLWEKSEDLREKAEEKAEEFWGKTDETKELFREKAAAIAAQMKERAGECCDGFQKIKELAREQAEAFFGAAEDTAEGAKECCEGCAQEAGDKAEEAMAAAREACAEFAEKGAKDLEDLAEAAQDAAKEAAARIFPEE